jgi:hypothetical protein
MWAAAAMALLYAVNAVGILVPSLTESVARFTNVEGRAKEGGIELLEAVLWGFAAIAFAWAAVRMRKRPSAGRRLRGPVLWSAVFAGLAFMALGEETSWGQVYGFYSAPERVASVNAQEEFNLHNLDVAEILGLDEDHFLVPWLGNLSHVINPIFYAFFLATWVVIPWMLRTGRLRSRLWNGYPTPSLAVSRFFALNVVAWLVVDRLLYDVGELFELSISITIALVAGEALAASRRTPRKDDVEAERVAEDLDDFVEALPAPRPDSPVTPS